VCLEGGYELTFYSEEIGFLVPLILIRTAVPEGQL